MKITNIRIEGKKPTVAQTNKIARALALAIARAGFSTDVVVECVSRIRVARGMGCFCVNTAKRGRTFKAERNFYFDGGRLQFKSYGGHAAWSHKVEFNHLLNSVLDSFGVSATVKARGFVIRQGVVSTRDYGDEGDIDRGNWDIRTLTETEAREQFPEKFEGRKFAKASEASPLRLRLLPVEVKGEAVDLYVYALKGNAVKVSDKRPWELRNSAA